MANDKLVRPLHFDWLSKVPYGIESTESGVLVHIQLMRSRPSICDAIQHPACPTTFPLAVSCSTSRGNRGCSLLEMLDWKGCTHVPRVLVITIEYQIMTPAGMVFSSPNHHHHRHQVISCMQRRKNLLCR